MQDFVSSLYSKDIYTYLKECRNNINSQSLRLATLQYCGVYFSAFASYLLQEFKFNIKQYDGLKEFVNLMSSWIMQFQYWNWLLLLDMNKNTDNYSEELLTKNVINLILNNLYCLSTSQDPRIFFEVGTSFYFGDANSFYKTFKSLRETQNNTSLDWYQMVPPLGIISEKTFDTFSGYSINQFIVSDYSLIIWMFISITLTLIGLNLYSRKDLL